MRNFTKIALFALLHISNIISNSFSKQSSFFMNDAESDEILKYNNKLEKNTNENNINNDNDEFYISGIFYIDKENWTVWINEAPFSKVGQYQKFSIDEVNENEVTLTLKNGFTINLSVNNFDED